MTDDDTKLLASLTGYTPGPWTGWNMIHADTGIPMTPDEIGEMVKNNVLQSIKDGGSAERFMFVSGETPIGPADMCHVGNGPNCLRNTALIAAAPDLHRIATEQAAEITRLRDALGRIASHRHCCHAYDNDMGHPLRGFDVDDVRTMEYAAKTALGDTHQ